MAFAREDRSTESSETTDFALWDNGLVVDKEATDSIPDICFKFKFFYDKFFFITHNLIYLVKGTGITISYKDHY